MASKGNQDPGWNDPPIFAYDKATAIQTAAANKKGISLNKRVAFPISGKIESTQAGLSTNLDLAKPPMMQIPSASSPIPTLKNESELSPKQDMDSFGKDMLNEVLQNLSLHTINDEEIVKRIRVMEKMWMENKLDENVCRKILELSKALVTGDADKADHIQKSLMVDKISQCSSWMSGVRHLINQKKSEKVISNT